MVHKLFGNVLNIVTLGDSQRGVCVPQVVDANVSQICLGEHLKKHPSPEVASTYYAALFTVKEKLRFFLKAFLEGELFRVQKMLFEDIIKLC